MSSLIIICEPGLGPLDVSVYPPAGDPIEFTLSAGKTSNALVAEPGRYTVVARRLDGTRIRQSTTVGSADAAVALTGPAAPTEAPRATDLPSGPPLLSASNSPVWWTVLGDLLGRTIGTAYSAFTANREPVIIGMAPSSGVAVLAPGQRLTLSAWTLADGRWHPLDGPGFAARSGKTRVSDGHVRVTLSSRDEARSPSGQAVCLGLRDHGGFGPMVIVPPFAGLVEVTFLPAGVAARADDRAVTPSQQRIPVAQFTPSTHAIADFLKALAASLTPDSDAIWRQASPTIAGSDDVDFALLVLLEKFERPAEALVAAHYLLRFMPKRLPLHWGENLARAIKVAADGPVISAWAWIYNRPADATDEAVDQAVATNVALALERPVTLFARTRSLLSEAQHLVAIPDAADRWAAQEHFRRAGAAAGGVESFWGRGPDSPGLGNSIWAQPLDAVALVNGAFRSL